MAGDIRGDSCRARACQTLGMIGPHICPQGFEAPKSGGILRLSTSLPIMPATLWGKV